MKTSPAGIRLLQQFESCRLRAYADTGGVLTIGWGQTGPWIKPYTTITQAEADALLRDAVAEREPQVTTLLTVPVTQNQFDSLISFSYNLGVAALAGSTLLKLLNAGATKLAAAQFSLWVHDSKGAVQPGLVRRRSVESVLFMTPDAPDTNVV